MRWSKVFWILSTLLWVQPALADAPQEIPGYRDLHWDTLSAEALANIPFKPVDPGILEHTHEKRGFVSVPFDYAKPDGRQLEIFYRLIPARGSKVTDSGKPILVVMNGGPGLSSTVNRRLHHDYEDPEARDASSELARYFRILAVDQRGTGLSSPLDLESPALSPEVIARYFDADEHARDHARVIEAVIPQGEEFFILARSYGGHIGFLYFTLEGARRMPAGMIFSSSLLPHVDAVELFAKRRERQRELNRRFKTSHPEIVAKFDLLRRHLASLEMDPATVNYLWSDLHAWDGWEGRLDQKLDRLLKIEDRAAMEADFAGGVQSTINLLNYVLSSASLTPGYTDRTMSVEIGRRVPFEDWMLDENWTLTQIGKDGTWREGFVASVDANPPPPTDFPPVEQIRRALSEHPVLFTFGRFDSFLPQEPQLESAQRFKVPGKTEYLVFNGGHGAASFGTGAKAVWEWAAGVLEAGEEDEQSEERVSTPSGD